MILTVWSVYHRLRNQLKATVRQAKVDYLLYAVRQSRQCSKKAAYMWSCVNNIIGRSGPPRVALNNTVSLNSINDFFLTVALTPQHSGADCFVVPPDIVGFTFAHISESLVLSHLSSLDIRKSTGPDDLSACFLKEVGTVIVGPLTQLYNDSLAEGIIPSAWKQSHISPGHKGGAVEDPSNYRPIVVVPVVAKVLEKIVACQFSIYLEEHKLLHPHQGAYCCGKSTSDILLLAVDHIVQSVDAGQAVCVSFLDLRKAFDSDSLDHCILLQRICDLGVGRQAILWFKNYLSGRVHRVKAGDRYSDWGSMRAGIPQGSALGPLLFLIYVNSLPSQVTNGILLQYTDDTTLVCSGTSPLVAAEVMNQQLQLVHDWIVSNKMQLNFRKSKVMWFSASLKKPVSLPEVVVSDKV